MSASGGLHILPPGAVAPSLLAASLLAASLILPWQGQWSCAAAVIIVLGVPHGALDVEIGRTLLRHRVGRVWFPLFAAPYLALVAVVLVAWRLAPGPTLAAFLSVTVWHFGTEEAEGGGLPALALGGLPVALPVLIQPRATAQVLSAISGVPLEVPPAWLLCTSLAWVPLVMIWACRILVRGSRRPVLLPLLQCATFALLPPLTAFALYFVSVHAPSHTAALVRHPTRAPRICDTAAAWRLSMPTTVLTVLIGAALWPFGTGEPAARLVGVTLQLLAALTLPHVLLDLWLTRRERTKAAPPPPEPPRRPVEGQPTFHAMLSKSQARVLQSPRVRKTDRGVRDASDPWVTSPTSAATPRPCGKRPHVGAPPAAPS